MKTRYVWVIVLATILVGMFAGGVVLAATLTGTPRDDTLIGTNSADTIRAKGGDDTVRGVRGQDALYGNRGADKVYGGKGQDKVYGGKGQDKIVGGYGRDKIYGGRGDDRLFSVDLISQRGNAYRDRVDCGPGYDRVQADYSDRPIIDCEVVWKSMP
jgi:Ca2+-binding RTX toxin-like protein